MAIKEFSIRWKHQFTDAPDCEFHCIADDEALVVEVVPTPDHLDSGLLIDLALRTFPKHGIDAVAHQGEGWSNARPPWKIVLNLGGVPYKIEIVEMMRLGNNKTYTVLLKP